jgi:biopolymer transport protein ExbD
VRFSSSRAHKPLPRLSIIPIIDVMMVLLLYFLMAGSMAADEAALPSALKTERGKSAPGDLQAQVLSVEPAGPSGVVYRLGQRELRTRDELRVLLRMLPRDAGIAVRVSGRVPVSAAAGAIQECRDAGFVKVSYVPAR